MRTPFVAGNWKMNGTRAEAEVLISGVLQGAASVKTTEIAVCPPFILIPLIGERLRGSNVRLGAQDLAQYKAGAYTGEVSGVMLRDFGCHYVIVGHSERRSIYGESDEVVAGKFVLAQEFGLVPILCVGETLEEREADRTNAVVERQLNAVLAVAGAQAFTNAVVAYEPVWAIGTGRNATPDQAQQVHAFIRGRLAREDKAIAQNLRILYGGSVKGANAKELFAQEDIDGGLIGGASLNAEEFLTICRAAD